MKLSRRARAYPGTIKQLSEYLIYFPDTGEIVTDAAYQTSGYKSKEGHRFIALPLPGEVTKKYYRADHIAWAMMCGWWPDGWIEHVNGVKADVRRCNLVFIDREFNRWWFTPEGKMVRVEETIRVMEGGVLVTRPRLVGEAKTYDVDTPSIPVFGEEWGTENELENYTESEGATEPDTESPADMPDMPEPDHDTDGKSAR